MRKVRIGNDINVRWEVKTDGQAVSLEGKALKLYVRSAHRKEEITTFTVEGCVVSFTYPASMQRMTGARAVILEDATEGAPRRTVCADQAFTLVAHSCEENDDDVEFEDFMVSLQSNVLIGKPGLSAYEVWLSEGNTGTLEDWYAFLRKPATDVAADVAEAEAERKAAETARQKAEDQRINSEQERTTSETERTTAEQARQENETTRVSAETERVHAELSRQRAEAKREQAAEDNKAANDAAVAAALAAAEAVNTAISEANTAASAANTATGKANAEEGKRAEAESLRAEAEAARIREEGIRQESETERVRKETEREAKEATRQTAETERVKADKDRTASVATAISNCTSAAKEANDAAATARAAGERATAMAAEAEKVNVTLGGSVISVTNRDGVTKTVDVVNTDETVNVTITSSVSSIKVSGVKINVFINNGKTPQTYTTNSEGKVSFVVNRGNYYQITFTEYGNAQPIAPVGFTAVLATRNIDVEYKPYDEESMENVVVTVTKYTDGTGAAYEGVPVVVTVDRKNTTYNADSKGQVSLYVPYGKEFTVNVENQDGYSVSLNRNTRTYTASVPQRLIDYKMYQFRAGIFIVDGNLNEYYLEEWQAAGKTAEEAVAIKVADANLTLNRGTFMIRISDMLAPTALPKKSWCTQDLQFDSIALNGNNTKDANYYNGESSSFLVRQEAVERSLSVPAFDYAYEQIFSIAGHELHGFLMSVGQDYVHIANISIIKQVLTALHGEEVATAYYNFVMNQRRWTSTQGNATAAWVYSSSADNNFFKSYSFYVLPVFAC
jgi:hypothetical protein